MNMQHHDAVLLVWIKNLSGFLVQLVSYLSPVAWSTRCVSAMAGEEDDAGKRNQYLLNEDSIIFWAMRSYTEKISIL